MWQKIFLSLLNILGLFIQTFRNYNEYGKLSYTIQTGNHLLNVVTALSITEKSACGDMDPEKMNVKYGNRSSLKIKGH